MVCKICGATVPETVEYCPNCGAKIEKNVQNIPLEDAPESPFQEFDPEDGTTVLTDGMSGPLVADQAEKKPREHQPQSPEGKVVTPAPVTGSSILSDSSVAPSPQAPKPGAPAPQPAQPQAVKPQVAPQAMQPQAAPRPMGQPAPMVQQPMSRPPMPPAVAGSPTVSPIGYAGYMLLFCLPCIGLIFAIVFAITHKNKNVKNFAIGWLIYFVIVLVLTFVSVLILRAMGVEFMEDLLDNLF